MVIICAKKEGVCCFVIDADGDAGMRRVKFARNYRGAIFDYWWGGGGETTGKFWGRAGFCATEILSTA